MEGVVVNTSDLRSDVRMAPRISMVAIAPVNTPNQIKMTTRLFFPI